MFRNIPLAIVAVSVLAPLALVPTGASAANYSPPKSLIRTFDPITITQPKPTPRTYTYTPSWPKRR
jgi:hypothetical protein